LSQNTSEYNFNLKREIWVGGHQKQQN